MEKKGIFSGISITRIISIVFVLAVVTMPFFLATNHSHAAVISKKKQKIQTIDGAFWFPSSQGSNVIFRVSVNPRGAKTLSAITTIICFNGTCKKAKALSGLGFFTATFPSVTSTNNGGVLNIQVTACSRLGCKIKNVAAQAIQSPSSTS